MPCTLSHPPIYRLKGDFWKFWSGQTISTLGSSFTSFALPLLIYKWTGSALNLSFTVVATVLPYLLFGLVIGAWADRVDRKRLMVWADLWRMLGIASIPLAAVFGLLTVLWIYAVAFINSALSICFDAANFAAIPNLMHRDDLVRANGYIQASYSTAKVAGPLLAGLLILIVPLPMLLLVDAASFLVSAGSLMLISSSFNRVTTERKATTSIRCDVLEGLRYVMGHPISRSITLLLLLINFLMPTTGAQLVLFAKQWYGASDTQLGLLYASSGIGTALFAITAHRLRKRLPFGAFILGSLMLEGLFTALPALTHEYWFFLLCWLLRGGVDALFIVGTYSLTQEIVPNDMLGRVLAFTRVLTWSTASVGALLGGVAIEQTKNVGLVYSAIGLLVFFASCTFALTPLRATERFIPARKDFLDRTPPDPQPS
jgi:MFS family permease